VFLPEAYVFCLTKIRYILNARRELLSLMAKKEDVLKFRESGPRTSLEEIGVKKEGNENLYAEILRSPEYILGEFDQDGYILPNQVSIDSLPVVDDEHFLPRKKFKIYLISRFGIIGVKKYFDRNTFRFVNELKAYLRLLGKNINIPSIMDVDFDYLSITFSFINGPTVRESLYNIGAVIIDHDVEARPELYTYPDENRWLIQTEDKSASLYRVVDAQFVENIFQQVTKIHNCDIYINDVKYGNVIIEKSSKEPYFIDFETSRDLSIFGPYIRKIMKDHETKSFGNLFPH
jgi:tRNA A-37 threonylcarbamoyl transferase component Bud32